jgi:hypothetical protein
VIGPISSTSPALGVTGPTGDQGPNHLGPIGPIGPIDQVSIGPTGSDGPIGLPGDPGGLGPKGPTGNQGLIGNQGLTGPNGGLVGPTGLSGQQGVKGPIGSLGPQGATGLGSTGMTGMNGPSGQTTISTFGSSTYGALFLFNYTITTSVAGRLINLYLTGCQGLSKVTGTIFSSIGLVPPPVVDTDFIVPVVVNGGFRAGLMRIHTTGQIQWFASVAGANFNEGDTIGFLATGVRYIRT